MTNIISQFQQRLVSDIGKALPPGSRVALVDYPNHPNVGDNAIWLGERNVLRALDVRCVYHTDKARYDRRAMAGLLGDGIVVIHGGGNFGDLWPTHQAFRERVIADFPNNRIVQLPQSIHFDDLANAKRVRAIVKSHGAFKLFVRDDKSRILTRDLLDIDSELTPDAAFALGVLTRPCAPTAKFIYLRRTDKEAAPLPRDVANDPGCDEWDGIDWLEPSGIERLLSGQGDRMSKLIQLGVPGQFLYSHYLDGLCRARLRRGLSLLSQGEVVISDRLHAMILSILAGIPFVALDNRVGKLSNYIETWLAGYDRVRLVSTFAEARSAASNLLSQPSESLPTS